MQFSAFPVYVQSIGNQKLTLGKCVGWSVAGFQSGAPESFPTCCVALGKPSLFLAWCPGV